MKQGATIALIAATLLAGCATTPTNRVNLADPTLTILDNQGPQEIKARLTNNANQVVTVQRSAFRLVDANRTVHPVDSATSYYGSAAFPLSLDLAQGESAEGWIIFDVDSDGGPYVLRYYEDYYGFEAERAVGSGGS